MPKNTIVSIPIFVTNSKFQKLEDVIITIKNKNDDNQPDIAALTNEEGMFLLKTSNTSTQLSFFKEGYAPKDTIIPINTAISPVHIILSER